MNDPAGPPFGPYVFVLSTDEAAAAAARLGLRSALSGGLTRAHLAPLAAFVLVVAFAGVLGAAGLMNRRAAEATLILAAAAFMIHRMTTRFRMRRARRDGKAAIEALRAAAELTLAVDENGATLAGPNPPLRLAYRDCLDAENSGGMLFLWPINGPPALAPLRVFSSLDEATALVAYLSSAIARARR